LDSKGKHVEAERAFRKGLDIWEGDPIPIMNNLALNLASQNNLEEAYEILMRAKTIAPNRIEVERNLRIVKALIETHNYDPKDYQ
jgi:Flp pilus assembly protein TadD